jgi:hypothetical protein
MNPLSRVLAAILAALAMAGAFFFGVFVLAFAMGIGLVAWMLFSVRLWWLRRKARISQPGQARDNDSVYPNDPGSGQSRQDITDVEYKVVERRDENF